MQNANGAAHWLLATIAAALLFGISTPFAAGAEHAGPIRASMFTRPPLAPAQALPFITDRTDHTGANLAAVN